MFKIGGNVKKKLNRKKYVYTCLTFLCIVCFNKLIHITYMK